MGNPDAVLNYSALGFNTDTIVDGGSDALLAAGIALGSLNGNLAEEKLDRFKLATGSMTESGTGRRRS